MGLTEGFSLIGQWVSLKASDWPELSESAQQPTFLFLCGSNFHQSGHFLKNRPIRSEPSVRLSGGLCVWLTLWILIFEVEILY